MQKIFSIPKCLAEFLMFWLLPLSLLFSYRQWLVLDSVNPAFAHFSIWVPAIAMLINVAVGAGYLKKWRFKVRYQIQGVVLQIGLVYSGVVNLLMLVWIAILGQKILSSWALAIILAASTALAGVLYDLIAVQFGFLEVYVRPYFLRQRTWKIVFSYGFLFFGLIGFLVAGSILAGYWFLVSNHQDWPGWVVFVFVLGIAIIAVPCSGFFIFKESS